MNNRLILSSFTVYGLFNLQAIVNCNRKLQTFFAPCFLGDANVKNNI